MTMLIPLGKRSVSEDVVDLLHECHGRIRRFLVMARQLALASQASPGEIADTAAQIRRYFAESFPLHVADEEVDIAPRVAKMIAPERLARMQAEHRAHSSAVTELTVVCDLLVRQPEQHAAASTRLHALAVQLAAELEAHMEFEERTVFPALRELSQLDRESILAAMRQRRSGIPGTGT